MNCQLADATAAMSTFEASCWRWYLENVNGFTLEAGIVADTFKSLRLRGPVRRLFGRAMNLMRSTFLDIEQDKLRA